MRLLIVGRSAYILRVRLSLSAGRKEALSSCYGLALILLYNYLHCQKISSPKLSYSVDIRTSSYGKANPDLVYVNLVSELISDQSFIVRRH